MIRHCQRLVPNVSGDLISLLKSDLKSFMERTLIGWEEKAIGEGLTRTWMGVKGHTIDRLPLIGAVPDRPGLFIAAGFNVSHEVVRSTKLIIGSRHEQ